jgi:hypothetical protein
MKLRKYYYCATPWLYSSWRTLDASHIFLHSVLSINQSINQSMCPVTPIWSIGQPPHTATELCSSSDLQLWPPFEMIFSRCYSVVPFVVKLVESILSYPMLYSPTFNSNILQIIFHVIQLPLSWFPSLLPHPGIPCSSLRKRIHYRNNVYCSVKQLFIPLTSTQN